MSLHAKEQASEIASHIANSPKLQGGISAATTFLGGMSIASAQTALGIVSVIVGILVGLYALVNAHKASKKADIEIYLLEQQKKKLEE